MCHYENAFEVLKETVLTQMRGDPSYDSTPNDEHYNFQVFISIHLKRCLYIFVIIEDNFEFFLLCALCKCIFLKLAT